MNLAKLPVWIIVMIQIFLFGAGISDADERCSCYSFKKSSPKSWLEARNSCRLDNKHLVAIETEREWKFINHKIQTRKNGKDDEWYIGLHKNKTTGNWIWVNGKALTIFKWQDNEPQDNDSYALMAKEFPPGHEGTFSGFLGNIRRGWICEEETADNCGGVCLSHIPVATNSTPLVTASPTTQEQQTISTAYNSTTAPVPEVDRRKDENNNSAILVTVAASLAGVLFVVLIILAVVLLLRRRKRRGHGREDEIPPKKSSHQPAQIDQTQYEPVNHAEVAKLLGTPDTNKAEKKIEHVSPSENCVYAVVNKKDKTISEGDLVYAELAEFDSANNDKTPRKPPSYEQTVYADVNVVPPEVRNPTSVDSTQPTYANVQTTGV